MRSMRALIRRDRCGFALLAVLWIIVGMTALGLAGSLAARQGFAASVNRMQLLRSRWRAEDCAERARLIIAATLAESALSNTTASAGGWGSLDRLIRDAPLLTGHGCEVTLRAAGAALDVNTASFDELHRLLRNLGHGAAAADSLADALLDWRDRDDIPRPSGAERSWYEGARRLPPRNGDLADIRELARVRGFDRIGGLDSLFSVERGRIVLAAAPLPVLAALDGLSDEALYRIAEARSRGEAVPGLLELSGSLSSDGAAALRGKYAELSWRTTAEPDAWILTSRDGRSVADRAAPVATVELRLVRAGTRAAIVRRRSWP